MTEDRAGAIWRAIVASNAAWMRGEPQAVGALYAEDAVVVAPGVRGRVEGRAAVVQSYVDYCRMVRTHAFREVAHDVEVRGEVAVATYRYEVRYELDGRTYDDVGQEVLVFARREGADKVVWRTQVTMESREVDASVPEV